MFHIHKDIYSKLSHTSVRVLLKQTFTYMEQSTILNLDAKHSWEYIKANIYFG